MIDRARNKRRFKRNGGGKRVPIDLETLVCDSSKTNLSGFGEAHEKLAQVDPNGAKLVEFCVFQRMSIGEAAELMGISRRTADRDWESVRNWLLKAPSE